MFGFYMKMTLHTTHPPPIKLNITNISAVTNRISDMEKGADAQTFSAEIYENCGNFWIVEEYLLLLLGETI